MNVIKRLFVPTISETIQYMVVSLVALGAFNLPAVFAMVAGDDYTMARPLLYQYFQEKGLWAWAHQFGWFGSVANILFWASVGAFVYLMFWAATSFYMAVHNDVKVGTRFVNPSPEASSDYVMSDVGHHMFQVCVGIVLAYFCLLSPRGILPFCIARFRSVILDWKVVDNWIMAFTAVFCLVVMLHVFAVLLRLLLRRVRVFD
jgi:hypothetical protein